jgi:hypothetical protein
MKCLKIVTCYFGKRRFDFNTPKDMGNYIIKMLENEINIENGVDTDVVFVNNNNNHNIELNSLLNSFNDVKTKNGKIIVNVRENLNGSFGAYYDMFFKYMDDYDYFFFCEDDVLIYKEKYISEFIEFLNSDESIGFVCLAPISYSFGNDRIHSGGGCGLSSKEKFLKVYSKESVNELLVNKRANNNNVDDYNLFQSLEIEFTNSFVRNGLTIKNHPKFFPLCDNYEIHGGQKYYKKLLDCYLKGEFIYKVGE